MKIHGVFRETFFKQKPWFMPGKLWRVVCNRANPRTEEQMRVIFMEKFPDGIFYVGDMPVSMQSEDRLVLIYPDSIGLGYASTEFGPLLARHVEFINGRRRHVHLTLGHWGLLLLKRFLSITFLPEIIFFPFILTYALACSVLDSAKGRV